MKHIKRNFYLDKLKSLNNTPDIKIVTGIRRSGKSSLLNDFIEHIKETEPNSNVIMINLLELENAHLLDYHALHEYALLNYQKNAHNLLVIDEVQMCKNFELAINSLHAKGIFDIYITGSNAFLLSSDLATLFTGRVMKIEVFPFSFSEYIEYFDANKNYEAEFDNYALCGGMPGSYVYSEFEQRYDYVREVYNTILIRDLKEKYKIRNEADFKNISEFMMDNISNILSANNICNCLSNNKSTITRKTVSKYINYLCNAFLFYETKRYDVKGKKYFENNNKFYLCDVSFRYAINGTKNMDFGRVYENLVALELLRRGFTIYVGKLYQKEVDFVATKFNEKLYIQVSDNIAQKDTLERELSSLKSIKDSYRKILIANTKHQKYDIDGIEVYDIARWLLDLDK